MSTFFKVLIALALIAAASSHLVPRVVPSWKVPPPLLAHTAFYHTDGAGVPAARALVDQIFSYDYSDAGSMPSDWRNALEFAGMLLSHHFNASTLPSRLIRVEIHYELQGCGQTCPLGQARPLLFCHDSSNSRYVPSSYARFMGLTGTLSSCDPESDIYVVLNGDAPFYVGTDGRCPTDKFDLVTTMLHELTHGMGFETQFSCDATQLECSYPSGLTDPTVYDRWLMEGSTAFDAVGATPSERFQFATSENGFQAAPQIVSGSEKAKIYVPATFVPGSSISHLSEVYDDTTDRLMTYSVVTGEVVHDIGGIVFRFFSQIGFSMRDCNHHSTCDECTAGFCQWCVYDNTCGDGRLQPYMGSCSINPGFISSSLYCSAAAGGTVASATSTAGAPLVSDDGAGCDLGFLQFLDFFCPASTLDSALSMVL